MSEWVSEWLFSRDDSIMYIASEFVCPTKAISTRKAQSRIENPHTSHLVNFSNKCVGHNFRASVISLCSETNRHARCSTCSFEHFMTSSVTDARKTVRDLLMGSSQWMITRMDGWMNEWMNDKTFLLKIFFHNAPYLFVRTLFAAGTELTDGVFPYTCYYCTNHTAPFASTKTWTHGGCKLQIRQFHNHAQ